MSSDFNQHTQTMIDVLAQTSPQDTHQMRRVFELSALIVQPDAHDFWLRLEQFPFEDLEPRVMVSLLSTPLDAEIVNKSPINWSQSVNLPAPRLHQNTEEPFIASHKHKLSLAPLFLLSPYLQRFIPEPQDAQEREKRPHRCRNFQTQCLDHLEQQGVSGETQMVWEPLTHEPLFLREIALALNSPHLVRWLDTFKWKDEQSLETTLLSLLSSITYLHHERAVAAYGKEKPSANEWFNIFNTLLLKVKSGSVDEVNLLHKYSLPHSNETKLSVAQVIFKILENEQGLCQRERVARAKKGPAHKVKQEDLGPEIENIGKQVLKDIFSKSLRKLSQEQQQQVVKDAVHTITANPLAWNSHLHPHCVFLMEAAPESLRDTVKREILQTKANCRSRGRDEPRNGFYLFDCSPIYKGILTVEEAKSILEKEVNASIRQDKRIWPLVLLMHMSPPQLQEGIQSIIQHIQSSPKHHSELHLEMAAMIARVDLPTEKAPKRKM